MIDFQDKVNHAYAPVPIFGDTEPADMPSGMLNNHDDRGRRMSDLDVLTEVSVACGPITLVVPRVDQILTLAGFVHDGLWSEGEEQTLRGWYTDDPIARARRTVAFYMDSWTRNGKVELPFAVVVDDGVVGMQGLSAAEPFSLTKEFSTGSWLAPEFRGNGFAVQMRWAALHIGFDIFEAQTLRSHALKRNAASHAVSTKCGYREDGMDVDVSRGVREEVVRFRIERDDWTVVDKPEVIVRGSTELLAWVQSDWDGTA